MRSKNRETMLEIEQFVQEYVDEYGRSPSMQEVGDKVGISVASAYRYITAMANEGRINYNGTRGVSSTKGSDSMTTIPIVGTVACGTPILAEENIEEYVRLPISLTGRGKFFILRAEGDSMAEVGIDDGDLVIIRQQNTAETGQIIVALIDDEATLKRYYPEPQEQRIRLHPENSEYDDIYVDYCQVQGIAVKVLKDLEGK